MSAAQIGALFTAVAAFIQASFATLAALNSAIEGGSVQTFDQIGAPPAPVPAWPGELAIESKRPTSPPSARKPLIMAHWTYAPALAQGVFPHEGGYTNDKADPGGPTNFGITIIDARKYWKPNSTAADVRAMPIAVAQDIYAKHYAAPLRYDELPAGIDYAVLDYGINSGIARSAKVLQRLCAIAADGRLGGETLAAVAARDPRQLTVALCDERLRFLKSLKTWPVFGEGWGRRVAEVKALALHFAGQAATMQLAPAARFPAVAAPSITPTADGEVMAKGVVPLNQTAQALVANRRAIAQASGPGGGGALYVAWDWVKAHPVEAAALGIVIVGGVAVIGYAIERAHRVQQEAPTPGLVPVPAA